MRKQNNHKKIVKNTDGSVAIEYGLIIALVVIAMIAGMRAVGGGNGQGWGKIASDVDTAINSVVTP